MASALHHIAAIALCALTAAAALAENGPTPFNFRVKLDGGANGGGVTIPPVNPNNPDPAEAISVTIIGPMNGQVATPFQMTASASGASAKTWTLAPSSGRLPSGLTLDASSGSISGQTDEAGLSAVLVLRASNAAGAFGESAPFRLNFLTQAQVATAAFNGPFAGSVGAQFAGASTSSGLTAPVRWTLGSGTLPAGLSLDPATGQIAGIPEEAGTRSGLSLVARGDNGVAAVTQTFQIAISEANPGALALAMSNVTAYAGQYVSRRAVAYGGTPRLTTTHVGTLPDGMTAVDATIAGVPTTPGTYTGLTAVANDAGGATAQASYTVTVLPAQAISISMPSQTVTVGEPLSIYPSVANATQPSTFARSQGTLPPGTSLDANTGAIKGTPTATGTYGGLVTTITDATGRTASTAPFTITVAPAAPLRAIVSSTTYTFDVPKTMSITVIGSKPGPYQYALESGTLPAGLSISNGTITGRTKQTGFSQNLTVRVTSADGTQAVSNVFHINVTGAGSIEVVMPEEIYPGTVGQQYDTAFSVRGLNGTGPVTGPVTWRFVNGSGNEVSHDMPGMTLNSTAGVITGIPSASFDASNIYLEATDAVGRVGKSQVFRLAAKPDFSIAWETGSVAPPDRVKKNAYFSAHAKVLPATDSYFSRWWYRKRGYIYQIWEKHGDPTPGMAVAGRTFSGYNDEIVGSRTYSLSVTDARGLRRTTPTHTTEFIQTSYIAKYDPVTMSECGGSIGDNYLFGGTWTSVGGKAVWTGWTGNKTSTHNPPRNWPSPASFGQDFDFYIEVNNDGHRGGTINIRVDQHRQLEGKINTANLLKPSDDGWLHVNQANPGNMPDFGSGKRSIFSTYGRINATFSQSGTFREWVYSRDWRTGEDVPYAVEVVVRPRDPPICGFVVN